MMNGRYERTPLIFGTLGGRRLAATRMRGMMRLFIIGRLPFLLLLLSKCLVVELQALPFESLVYEFLDGCI